MRGAVTYAQENEDKVYAQIRRAIALYGYTQDECGAVIGITQASFSKAMKNQTLTIRQLCELACEFHCEVRICDRG